MARRRRLRKVFVRHAFPADVLRAIQSDDPALLDACIASSLDLLDVCDAGGSGLLHLAARYNALKVAQYLVEGWDYPADSWDLAGWEPVHEAVAGGHTEMIRLLYEVGADLESPTLDSPDGDGNTPLALAIVIAERRHVNPVEDPMVRAILALIRPKGSAR